MSGEERIYNVASGLLTTAWRDRDVVTQAWRAGRFFARRSAAAGHRAWIHPVSLGIRCSRSRPVRSLSLPRYCAGIQFIRYRAIQMTKDPLIAAFEAERAQTIAANGRGSGVEADLSRWMLHAFRTRYM